MKVWTFIIFFIFSVFSESVKSATSMIQSPCLIANSNPDYSRHDEIYNTFLNEQFVFFFGEIINKDRKNIVTKANGHERKIVQHKLTYKVTNALKGTQNRTLFDVWHYFQVPKSGDVMNFVFPQGEVLVKIRYNQQGQPELMLGDFVTGDCIDRKPISDDEFIWAYNRYRIVYFSLLGFCFVLIGFATYPIFTFLKKRKSNGRAG